MASAAEHTARLDRSLARNGETVTLRRLTLGPGNTQVPFDCECGARVSAYQPHELVGGIVQGDSKVILSPTSLRARQWPGPGLDPLPRSGDRVGIGGRERNVQTVTPVYAGGGLVRIELLVRG
jgi:hypothetical protein